METVVISIGGSVLVPDDNDADYMKKLAGMLLEVSKEFKIFVVTGGGRISRYYIETGRALNASEEKLDQLGIDTTRLNAKLLITALGDHANPEPALNFDEAIEASMRFDVVVMGGTVPGHTTDAVSATLAEKVKAEILVNATSVDGIYTSDPKKNPDAVKIHDMTIQELIDMTAIKDWNAGPTVVFDPIGAEILARARIQLHVCNGRDLEALRNAIVGKDFEGTIVK